MNTIATIAYAGTDVMKQITKKVELILDFGVMGEMDCVVEYIFHPEELPTRDNPGCPHELTILSIEVEGLGAINMYPMVEHDKVEPLVLEAIKEALE